ncbi:receptor like protein 52 [Artemisia annua]|uniref:Receptor like protein 52 n=1 Tax=Artemisia annua TaxID=35608 RepID=A0A2U1MVY5_ARTAN|nr:receptor like protein 52 [Artemisia annua]
MFSGNVPFDSFTSPSLYWLDLSHNQLGGQIDVQTFPQLTNLTYLFLSFNNFSGELELDSLLSTLTNLKLLYLSYSGFSVTTKNTGHYVNPGLWFLKLASCKLKVFPNSLRAMKKLQILDLSQNEIHGQIPHWAGEIGGDYGLEFLNLRFLITHFDSMGQVFTHFDCWVRLFTHFDTMGQVLTHFDSSHYFELVREFS